jgi:hypothetical protein
MSGVINDIGYTNTEGFMTLKNSWTRYGMFNQYNSYRCCIEYEIFQRKLVSFLMLLRLCCPNY